MWTVLRHPLTIALVGIAITGVLVPHFARRWQNEQKALDVRVSLVGDMSESLMSVMTLVERVHKLAELIDGSSSAGARQEKLREELHRVWDSLNEERQEFQVREAVIGTKLQAYLPNPEPKPASESEPTVADRWFMLADVLTGLVDFEGSDADHRDGHRTELVNRLSELDPTPLDSQLVDGELWLEITSRISSQKVRLIKEVLHAPMVFRASWIPWR